MCSFSTKPGSRLVFGTTITCRPRTQRPMTPADAACFFFFQAEDGIRYVAVTGVQTCALPIFIILTASGKFFSPGADIKELAELNTVHQGSELSGRGQALLNRVERFDKPVIAAINGACLGGGLELAMACHMRVAAAGILLGLPEIKLGLIPGFGGTQRLPRIIGPSKARQVILTGETVNSEEALTLGLVNRGVPPEENPKAAPPRS